MRKLYLTGLPRLQSVASVLYCQGSDLADESHSSSTYPLGTGGRPNDHGPIDIINKASRPVLQGNRAGYFRHTREAALRTGVVGSCLMYHLPKHLSNTVSDHTFPHGPLLSNSRLYPHFSPPMMQAMACPSLVTATDSPSSDHIKPHWCFSGNAHNAVSLAKPSAAGGGEGRKDSTSSGRGGAIRL